MLKDIAEVSVMTHLGITHLRQEVLCRVWCYFLLQPGLVESVGHVLVLVGRDTPLICINKHHRKG